MYFRETTFTQDIQVSMREQTTRTETHFTIMRAFDPFNISDPYHTMDSHGASDPRAQFGQ